MSDYQESKSQDDLGALTQPTELARPSGPHGLITGTGLGKYRILERLRTTHNAIIYKARDAMLDRLVSLKQLSPGFIDDPVACGDFKREAQLLARMSGRSRHVSHVYELIGDGNGFFISEEYIEGDTLELQISKRQLTADDAANLLRHGCLALGTLQAERIVHRDACPANWLVGKNGRLILTNFSTATREGDNVPPSIVQAKYAAPEILLGEACDCRADLYSFGMLLYEICVGRARMKDWCARELGSPKPQEADWRAWQVNSAAMLPNARDLNANISDDLAELLVRLTAKDVDDRIGSCQQILKFVQAKLLAHATGRHKAIGGAGDSQIIEIRRAQTRISDDGSGQRSLNHLVREDQSTTTTNIAASSAKPLRLVRKSAVTAEISRPRNVPSRNISGRQARPIHRRLPQQPVIPPKPVEVEEPARTRPRFALAAAIIAVAAISLTASGYLLSTIFKPHKNEPTIARLIDEAETARRNGDFPMAERQLREALLLTKSDPSFRPYYEKANRLTYLVDAASAIASDEFDSATDALDRAAQLGVAAGEIAGLREKLAGRREAIRIEQESETQLANNNFESVELSLPDYRRNAEIGGIDKNTLDRKLDESKADERYRLAVDKANAAIKAKDFDMALVAARDALSLRDVPETRRLHDMVVESKRQHSHRIRGDKAFSDGDFAEAEREYQTGLALMPDEDIEHRLRLATAARLLVEAQQSLATGDLLDCERRLKNSLWQVASTDAKAMLKRLEPAFDAARMVESAKASSRDGDKDKAIRLLQTAIPDLPSPARDAAQSLLDRLLKE